MIEEPRGGRTGRYSTLPSDTSSHLGTLLLLRGGDGTPVLQLPLDRQDVGGLCEASELCDDADWERIRQERTGDGGEDDGGDEAGVRVNWPIWPVSTAMVGDMVSGDEVMIEADMSL